MGQIYKIKLLSVFLVNVFLMTPLVARANEKIFTPQISVQTIYDDSIVFNDEDDSIFLLTPKFSAQYGEESWNISAGGNVDIYRYAHYNDYDKENYALSLSGTNAFTERFIVGFSSGYNYDHSFEDELEDSGVISSSSLRRRYSFTPNLSYMLTEKDQLSFSLPLSLIRYSQGDNDDSDSYGGSLVWARTLNDSRVQLLSTIAFNNYLYKRETGDSEQDTYRFLLGFTYQVTEVVGVAANFGVGLTQSDDPSSPQQETEDTYFTYDVSGTYNWDRWFFKLTADRRENSSSYNELSLRTRGQLDAEYNVSERFKVKMSGAYYRNETSGITTKEKSYSYFLKPSLSYSLSERSDLRFEYSYNFVHDEIDDSEEQRNRFSLVFDYRYPIHF